MKEIICRITDAEWTDRMVTEDDNGTAIHEYGIMLTLVDEKTGQIIPSYLSSEDVKALVRTKQDLEPTKLMEIAKMLAESKAVFRVMSDPNQIGLTPDLIAVKPLSEENTPHSVLCDYADALEDAKTDLERVDILHNIIAFADSMLEDIVKRADVKPPTPKKRKPKTIQQDTTDK